MIMGQRSIHFNTLAAKGLGLEQRFRRVFAERDFARERRKARMRETE